MKATILVDLKHGNIDGLWEYLAKMGMLVNGRFEVIDIMETK